MPLTAAESSIAADKAIEFLRKYARERANTLLANKLQCLPPFVFLEMGRHGLLGMVRDKEVGGAGLRVGDAFRVLRQLSCIDLSSALAVGLHNFLSGTVLIDKSSPELRAELEPELASGRRLGCFALTEPGAGSDPRRISATAHVQPDGSWKISGHKIWSGVAAWAGWGAVFARAYDESNRELGITAFAVPMDSEGIVHGTEAETMGLRGVVQSEFWLKDVVVPAQNILGGIGRGLDAAQASMMFCRLVCCIFAAGAMMRSIQLVGRYLQRRTISTGSMADNPIVQDMFAREAARTRAVCLYLDWCSDQLNAGQSLSPFVLTAAKVYGPEDAFQTVDACMQLLGGRGYIETNVIPRMLRDIRVVRVFEGPTETITGYLGSMAILKPGDLAEVFAGLNAGKIWDQVRPLVEGANPRSESNKSLDRAGLLRLQSHAGQAAAAGLWLAIVEAQAGQEDSPAVDLRREELDRVISRPPCTEPWTPSASAWSMWSAIDSGAGLVDEQRGGFDPLMDALLEPLPG